MFESDVGLSVSFTRQCCGIGGRLTGAPPAAAGGATPALAAGGGGGVNTPAATTSADVTVVLAVDSDLMASQLVGMLAASKSVAAIIIGFLVPGSGFQFRWFQFRWFRVRSSQF